MGVHRLRYIWLLFILLVLLFMSGKRKSSTAKSAPCIKISRSTDDQQPTVHIRNITLHSLASGRLAQNVSHTPQTAMFADLPNLLDIEDDDDEVIDVDMADAAVNDIGGLSEDIPSNDPDDDAPGKVQSKESVSTKALLSSIISSDHNL
jgi:hypothetical protein